MPKRVSGKRYAQALFELAVECNQLEQWAEELQFTDQVLQDEEFLAFLQHAEVPLERKISAVDTVLQDVTDLIKNLVYLLITRGAVGLVHEVQIGYGHFLDEHRGRQRVEVTSAVLLEDQELERITRFAANLVQKEVVVSTRVDESILGGVIIQIGDQLLDGSTRSRLEELRKQIRSDAAASGA
jgi:F-type H+-transporting ATPase subunit delta